MIKKTVFLLIFALDACGSGGAQPGPGGDSVLYVMPAESAPHEGTWLQWPHEYEYGVTYRNRLEPTWVAMTREIVSGERAHIIAYDPEARDRIISRLTADGVDLSRVDFYLFRTNDVWVRDNGPVYVRDKQEKLVIEGWGFNGWGGKEEYGYDVRIPAEVAKAEKMPFVDLSARMILEGGAVELDGKGSLMATRSAILNPDRNPGLTQRQAEELFTIYLGRRISFGWMVWRDWILRTCTSTDLPVTVTIIRSSP